MKKRKWSNLSALAALFALFALLLPAFVGAYPAEVPRTGQTTSYATGDDADLLAGVPWPDLRFTDRVDGTVTDNLTGLVWAKNANLPDGSVSWQDALTYVADMNAGTCPNFGHTDWRLPNVNELESLVNAGAFSPALPSGHPFSNVQLNNYWSSTSYSPNINRAWVVGMDYGNILYSSKTGFYYVWPVCSGQCGSSGNSIICLPKTGQTTSYSAGDDGDIQAGIAWPAPRFTANGDAVTDNLTGLVWAQNANLPAGYVTWPDALNYIAGMNAGSYQNFGYTDWRLPNRRELRSLADYALNNPALPSEHPFSNVQLDYPYWSSTYRADDPAYAWAMGMYRGNIGYSPMTDNDYVWPVRSGQIVSKVDLVIAKSGTGTGTVISNDGKINCGSDCAESYTIGTEATLTATADAGSAFAGWSGGGCSGTGQCLVTVTENVTVTANFNLAPTTTTTTIVTTSSTSSSSSSTSTSSTTTTVCPAPDLNSPTGPGIIPRPTFTWQKVDGVVWYNVAVYYVSANGYAANQWFDPAVVCTGTTCSAQLNNALYPGQYWWWLNVWYIDPVCGFKVQPGSKYKGFTVDSCAGPTLSSPDGDILGQGIKPAFTFSDSGAEWYNVMAWSITPWGQWLTLNQWADAGVVCSGGNCSVQSTLALPLGTTWWWLNTWSQDCGYQLQPGGGAKRFTVQ